MTPTPGIRLASLLVAACLPLPTQGQAPESISGRTVQLTATNATPPFVDNGSYRLLMSGTDDAFALVPVTPNFNPSSGTYTYALTGTNTARLRNMDATFGVLIADCVFDSPASGQFLITSEAVPGLTQSGTFTIFSGSAPGAIAGRQFDVSITGGREDFERSGSYRLEFAGTGGTYALTGGDGAMPDAAGPFTYARTSPSAGVISYTNSSSGTGFTSQLSFESATNGTVLLRSDGIAGFQTADFVLAPPQGRGTAFEPPTWDERTGLTLILRGDTQTAYRVQWSTNLNLWTDWTNVVAGAEPVRFLDRTATTNTQRWYRAVSP
jgi:hypothetical protein